MSYVSKSSAGNLWDTYRQITQNFAKLSCQPSLEDVQDVFSYLERFTVLLCDRTSNSLSANECRRNLFTKEGWLLNIPTTTAALSKHIMRTSYITGYVWSQNFQLFKFYPHTLTPDWTNLPEASFDNWLNINANSTKLQGPMRMYQCWLVMYGIPNVSVSKPRQVTPI